MGQILHGSAKTTYAIREELQRSEATTASLSRLYNINPKTVIKWRKRKAEGVADRSFVPKKTRTVLTQENEALIIAFRKTTGLALDDCFDALIEPIPHLTRSNLYRCLKRYGLSVLPSDTEQKEKKQFKKYDIGYVHLDITEVRVEDRKLYIYVGICRVCKYVYTQIYESQTLENTCEFLDNLVKACPFKIHTILTDNGSQFAHTNPRPLRKKKSRHNFTLLCTHYGIRHRKTKFYTPKTNGQVERFNRTLKDATTKQYHYANKVELEHHLLAFTNAYNFCKKLSSLKRKTPIESILTWWHFNPKLFIINPNHLLLKLNN